MGSPVGRAWWRVVSRQLGGPSGPLGALAARALNRGNRVVTTEAVTALGLSGSETVVDIGFGGGVGIDLLLAHLHPWGHVHGVDPSRSMVRRIRRRHRDEIAADTLTAHQGSMQALPFSDGQLDGWISLNTIYFVPDLAPAARELRRVLAPTGCGVLGVADPDWMRAQPFTREGFTLRPLDEDVAALEAAGLRVERRTVADARMPVPYHLLVCRPGGLPT